jgi:putative oxidoreductase
MPLLQKLDGSRVDPVNCTHTCAHIRYYALNSNLVLGIWMDKKEGSKVGVDRIKPSKLANSFAALSNRLDEKVVRFMSSYAILIIRISLGIVFVWFGLLKVMGTSPVYDLASHVVYWLPPELFVPLLGIWEMAIGIGLLLGKALRVVLSLLFLQLAGTFLVLVMRPETAFQGGNPLLLTMEGEFVVKNLVLIAAGLAVGGTARHIRKEQEQQRLQKRTRTTETNNKSHSS